MDHKEPLDPEDSREAADFKVRLAHLDLPVSSERQEQLEEQGLLVQAVVLVQSVPLAPPEGQGLLDYVEYPVIPECKVFKEILVFLDQPVQLVQQASWVLLAFLDFPDPKVLLDQLDLRDSREMLDSLAVQDPLDQLEPQEPLDLVRLVLPDSPVRLVSPDLQDFQDPKELLDFQVHQEIWVQLELLDPLDRLALPDQRVNRDPLAVWDLQVLLEQLDQRDRSDLQDLLDHREFRVQQAPQELPERSDQLEQLEVLEFKVPLVQLAQ